MTAASVLADKRYEINMQPATPSSSLQYAPLPNAMLALPSKEEYWEGFEAVLSLTADEEQATDTRVRQYESLTRHEEGAMPASLDLVEPSYKTSNPNKRKRAASDDLQIQSHSDFSEQATRSSNGSDSSLTTISDAANDVLSIKSKRVLVDYHFLFIPMLPLNSQRIEFLSNRLVEHGAKVRQDTFMPDVTHIVLECSGEALHIWSKKANCSNSMPLPMGSSCNAKYVKPSFVVDILDAVQNNKSLPSGNATKYKLNIQGTMRASSRLGSSMQISSEPYIGRKLSTSARGSSTSPTPSSSALAPAIKTTHVVNATSCTETFPYDHHYTSEEISYMESDELAKSTCIKSSIDTSRECGDIKHVKYIIRLAKSHRSWACQISQPMSEGNSVKTCNAHLAKHFEEIADIYKTLDCQGSTFRERGFRKASRILKITPVEIYTREQAKKYLKPYEKGHPDTEGKNRNAMNRRRLSPKMYGYVLDVLENGCISRLDQMIVAVGSRLKAWRELEEIHGVGPKASRRLYNMGFKCVNDLHKAMRELSEDKKEHILNTVQRIGLKHHADLQKRIPRSEVASIAKFVTGHARALVPNAVVECCGSYRRGKETSGDCDVMITVPQDIYGNDIDFNLESLIDRLRRAEFLVDDLSFSKDRELKHTKQTYMGICKLKGEKYKYCRRLDIKTFPRSSWAFAKLYFTGSDWFNRSMRLWCKKIGWTLSDMGLSIAFRRNLSSKVFTGNSIKCETEEQIFEALGLNYVPPELRSPDLFL